MGSSTQELADAEVSALFCGLSTDQKRLLRVIIHRRNDGLGGEAVHARRCRVAVLAVSLDEFVSMARMYDAVEGSDSSVFKVKVVKDPPQPGVLDGARRILGWYVLTDALNDLLDPRLTKPRFKLPDTRQVRGGGAAGCHPLQRRGQIRVWHIIQIVDPGHCGEVSKSRNESAYALLRFTHYVRCER